jgi:hypothetical protein
VISHRLEHGFEMLLLAAFSLVAASQLLPGAVKHHGETVRVIENTICACIWRDE